MSVIWTCIIAGGSDHATLLAGWKPAESSDFFVTSDSKGVSCPAAVVRFDGAFSTVVFRHPGATLEELQRAESSLKCAVDSMRRTLASAGDVLPVM